MTWRPGCGSPIGADEIAEAEAWSANAPPFEQQLRTILAEPETFPGEHDTAREMLAAIEKERADAAE